MKQEKCNKVINSNNTMSTGGQLTILEKVIELIEKHGLLRIFTAIFVIMAFFFVIYNSQNVNKIVDMVLKKQKVEHSEALEYRKKISHEIELILTKLLLDTGADRAFIIEMHNGNSNVSGLPFYYGEMTYEKVTSRTYHIDEDYSNLNLSRFPFIYYLEERNSWFGSIEDLSKIDERLSMRLKSNDVSYAFFESIQGIDTPIGFIGITYCNGHIPDINKIDEIAKIVNVVSKKVSGELDMQKINFNDV